MSDLREQLYDYVESTIERVDIDDVAAAASTEPTARPKPTLRRPVWAAAGAALLVILLIGIPLLFIGNGDSTTADTTPPTVPATTVAPPTTQPVPTTTPPPSPDAGEETGTAAMITPPIEATWTLAATVDGGWLTEPVSHNDGFLARHKALDEGVVEGWINTDEGWGGQMWESTDGVTWVPAGDDQQWPPPPTDASTTGSAVIVEYEGNRATERVGRLLATSDGSTWREINLRPYEDNWVPRVAEGGLGWLVYSPPMARGASWSAPRLSNHGLWYTPDTEAWFEVANLGPLVNYGDIGEVGVWDVAMIVRDDDIFVFAYIAENFGFGNGSQHRTEIWRLDLSHGEPVEAFDFSTQSLCDWFSPEDIDAIVARAYEDNDASPIPPPFEDGSSAAEHCWWHSGDISTVGLAVIVSETFIDYDEDGPIDDRWRPHSALSEGVYVDREEVVVGSHDDFEPGVELRLLVEGREHPLEYWHKVPPGFDGDADAVLAIADEMLRSMGWVPVPGD